MTRDEFLTRIQKINVSRLGGERAPHKPLLVLLALGCVLREKDRLLLYRSIENPLKELLRDFGQPRETHHPEYPFGRLCADGLWEIPQSETLSHTSSGDLRVKELRDGAVTGGFPQPAYDLLLSRPEIAIEASRQLLRRHFPPSLHADIRAAVGLPYAGEIRDQLLPPRDPGFRKSVLREYQRRCAVCKFDVRLGDELIGLEAAHIKWRYHDGPDDVRNGLALCGLHHKALDRGALGLQKSGSFLTILISKEINGNAASEWFSRYHGQQLCPPIDPKLGPKVEFVEWHRRQVFREPAMPWPT